MKSTTVLSLTVLCCALLLANLAVYALHQQSLPQGAPILSEAARLEHLEREVKRISRRQKRMWGYEYPQAFVGEVRGLPAPAGFRSLPFSRLH